MTGIVGIVLAVLSPQGAGCQGPPSVQPAGPPDIAASSSTSSTTPPATTTNESLTAATSTPTPGVTALPPPQRPSGPQPTTPVTGTTVPLPRPPGSYSAQPVKFEASKWCEYGTLDIETRAARYYEATDGHEPGVDLIYDGCGPGATLTTRRTNSPALGRGSLDSTTAEQCRQDAQSQNTQAINNVPAGQVLCLITGEGGVARIVVTALAEPYTEDGGSSLELEITYWAP